MSSVNLSISELSEVIRKVFREEVPPLRACLTRAQLAEEWQCSEQAIKNWTERRDDPLPVDYIGADPRYYRAEFSKWTKEEAARKNRKLKAVA